MKLWLSPLFLLSAAAYPIAYVGTLDRYPGYTGVYNITGEINIWNATTGPGYQIDVAVSGGQPDFNHTFHIHTGVTCANASLVGGHLWSPFNTADPWTVPQLLANATGDINGSFTVNFGYDFDQFIGHALVIHDPNGIRTACGLIVDGYYHYGPSYYTAELSPYPGYNGTLNVTGIVEVWDHDDGVSEVVNFRLKGVENNVTGGVHIHVGTTCSGSGAHYWANASAPDPWTTAKYQSNNAGIAEGSLIVDNGYLVWYSSSTSGNRHHAVVIHDSAGNRVACGLLDGAEATYSPTASSAPTNSVAPTNSLAPTPNPTHAPSNSAAPTTAAPSSSAAPTSSKAPTSSSAPTPAVEACANTQIKAVFTACKKYDFSAVDCSVACATSLQTLVNTLVTNHFNLTESTDCLDVVNATNPWVNGDLASLKSRFSLTATICNATNTTDNKVSGGASVVASGFVAGLIALFL